MNTPTLIIMAAGMGSRFGGLKQIMPVDDAGHAIIDFSLYDAYRAGFRRVVFVIKKAIADDFRAAVGARAERMFDVSYVFQELDCLPEGFTVPDGREKPWGTAHAVACTADVIDGPFVVINSDDFYGPGAYRAVYDALAADGDAHEHFMVAYRLRNTVTENGYVSRGVCTVSDGCLTGVTERTHIEKRGSDAAYADGDTMVPISGDTLVSMNFWGFRQSMMARFADGLPDFLRENLPVNPLKCEYFLPSVVNGAISSGTDRVRVLPCDEVWYGMTYREDLGAVRAAIADMKARGIYPDSLFEG